jgi:hypothetical protein
VIGRDEVLINVTLHELDFVSLLRASRLMGLPRDEIVRRAVGGYLVSLQKQGLDVGIVLPPEPKQEAKEPQKAEAKGNGKGRDSSV